MTTRKNKDPAPEKTFCNTTRLAEIFGVSMRSVQTLVRDGVIPRVSSGKFELYPAVKAYIKHLRDRIGGHVIEPGEDDLKARLLRAQAEDAEAKAAQRNIALAVQRGELFKKDDVKRQWTSRLIEFKAAILELPKRAAFRFTDPAVRLLVEEEVSTFVIELLERYSRSGILPDGPVGVGDYAEGFDASQEDNG